MVINSLGFSSLQACLFFEEHSNFAWGVTLPSLNICSPLAKGRACSPGKLNYFISTGCDS